MADCEHGYQNPGLQNISANEVIAYFVSNRDLEKDVTDGNFDYVVIGSSFCAMGFIHQVLIRNPNAKILIIERGDFVDPQAIQDLTPHELGKVEKKTESFHWKIHKADKYIKEDKYIKYTRGVNNLFGGRSCFWKAWCPKPTEEEMAGWPGEVIDTVQKSFPDAADLLSVKPANEIEEKGSRLFGCLQQKIFDNLKVSDTKAITKIEHAPLAVIKDKCR